MINMRSYEQLISTKYIFRTLSFADNCYQYAISTSNFKRTSNSLHEFLSSSTLSDFTLSVHLNSIDILVDSNAPARMSDVGVDDLAERGLG